MRSALRRIAKRFDRDEERGIAVIWLALTIGIFIMMAAFAVDLLHAYVEQAAAQRAADAAALAGAAEIPYDPSGGLGIATGKATQLAHDNGFNTVDDTVTPSQNANKMQVVVTRKFKTFFAGFIGIREMTVKKTAVAIYDAPVRMGSPANNLGDVPACPAGVASPCVNPPGNANQNLWGQVEGQGAGKTNGNAYTTNNCSNGQTDGCSGGVQTEYNGDGELILVHSDGAPTDVYLYDAPYVSTGVGCTSGTPLAYAAQWDPITSVAIPGNTYGTNSFCSGDNVNTSLNPALAMQTRYSLYAPSPTTDPHDALTAAPLCTFTADGYTDPGAAFAAGSGGTDPTILQTFHQWYKLPCGVSGSGDYVLRVTAPRLGDVGANAFSVLALQSGHPGNARVFMQKALPLYAQTTPGNTSEFYVARVLPSPGRNRTLVIDLFDFGDASCNSACPSGGSQGKIQVIWDKSRTHPTQPCKWVPPPQPAAEGGNPAPPNNGDPLVVGGGPISTDVPGMTVTSDPANCTWGYATAGAGLINGNWNARWVTLLIPVPGDYTCNQADDADCWLKLQVTPKSGGVAAMSDATTWYAHMNGSPVALVS